MAFPIFADICFAPACGSYGKEASGSLPYDERSVAMHAALEIAAARTMVS